MKLLTQYIYTNLFNLSAFVFFFLFLVYSVTKGLFFQYFVSFDYILISIFLILFNYFFNLFTKGKFLSFKMFVFNFLIFMIALKAFYLVYYFFFLNLNNYNIVFNFNWLDLNFIDMSLSFYFDPLSSIMVLVISLISFLVHLFALDYMSEDLNKVTFFNYLNLFTFFMILMVISGNLVLLFIGWEGVGVTSYLLINFWYNRFEANKSSLKAIVMNKVGDVSLMFFVAFCYYFFNTFEILKINFLLGSLETSSVMILGFLVFFAAIAKSARLGLHTWLPDAMEGPTPVSALLHAATMVTAGVYLLVRFSFIVESLPLLSNIIVVISSLTVIFGSLLAVVQVDIKKIIAFSTLSQLGYMFCAIGLGGFNLAMFHLVTHAFFKALLFLCSGVIIHNLNNEQDIRKYGSLISLMPMLYTFMLIGFLALSGFPFLSGYYSKDLIIELALSSVFSNYISFLSSFLLNFGAFLTTFYSIRSIYYLFFATPNLDVKKSVDNCKDLNLIQFFSLTPLVIGSIFLGYFFFPFIVGSRASFVWSNTIAPSVPLNLIELLPVSLKLIPFFCFLIGALSAVSYYWFVKDFFKEKLPTPNFFTKFLFRKFYFDIFLNRLIAKSLIKSYNLTFNILDRGFLQNLTESVSNKFLKRLNNIFKKYNFFNYYKNQLNLVIFLYSIIVLFTVILSLTF